MNSLARILWAPALVAALVAGAGWSEARSGLRACRIGELAPIAGLLKEDQELLKALQTDSALGKDSGILGSYLAAIRADGIAKHADMKQRLDRLAENNAAILALINVYKPQSKTTAFDAEAEKFRRYAIAWRDRWNSVTELYMAGGNYPVAEVPFRREFATAVDAEMSTAAKVLWPF